MMDSYDLSTIAHNVGVPIKKLSAQTMATVNSAPQAQKRTSKGKKSVKIVNDLVFKGPYTSDKDFFKLMNNLKFTYAIQILEEALQLPGWQMGALPWECIGQSGTDQYYLVAPNIGRWKDIPFELKSSKIEKDVSVVPRGGAIWRVSDIEKNGQLAAGIKLASLQHLYFRFLFDIGDTGTYNILIRRDTDRTDRLIAGIDLEEKITDAVRVQRSRVTKQCLDLLFSRKPSKANIDLYQSDVRNIKSITYRQLDQQTIDRLDAVDINLEDLKANMARW
jgi:hypothetical protein